jgi:DNA invertase Pin-like site-specific DNA recombinase
MSIVGYARVSSIGQSLEIQKAKLSHCDKIFTEKRSGSTTENRTALKQCLNYLRDGDTLVITKLDRLARSTFHLTQIAEQLKNEGIELVVTDQNIDTSTPTGRLLFSMLGAIGEFENEIRRERQLDGITHAKERGVRFGAKPKLTDVQIDEMRQKRVSGVLIKDLMKEYSLSKASVYRLLSPPDEHKGLNTNIGD